MVDSTGVYWKPVYNIISDHLTFVLVNPGHLKNIAGRKTDMKYCVNTTAAACGDRKVLGLKILFQKVITINDFNF
jgi:hypothetical protein